MDCSWVLSKLGSSSREQMASGGLLFPALTWASKAAWRWRPCPSKGPWDIRTPMATRSGRWSPCTKKGETISVLYLVRWLLKLRVNVFPFGFLAPKQVERVKPSGVGYGLEGDDCASGTPSSGEGQGWWGDMANGHAFLQASASTTT